MSSMYDDKNLVYFFTILESIEKIYIYTREFEDDEAFYMANEQMNFNAVVGLLIGIGEESKKIDLEIKNEYPFVWSEVTKMRDKISHNYRGINPYTVWETLQGSLKEYKSLIVKILPRVHAFQEVLDDVLESDFYRHLGYLKTVKSQEEKT